MIGCGAAKEGSLGREPKEYGNPDHGSCGAATQNRGESPSMLRSSSAVIPNDLRFYRRLPHAAAPQRVAVRPPFNGHTRISLSDSFAYRNELFCDTLCDQEPLVAVHAGPVRCCVLSEAKLLNFIRSLRSQRIKTPTPSVNENKRRSSELTTSGRSVTERMAAAAIRPRRCIDSLRVPMIKVLTTKVGWQPHDACAYSARSAKSARSLVP